MTDEAKSEAISPESKPKPALSPNKKSSGALLFLVVVTFFISVGTLAAGYFVWIQLQKELALAKEDRQALQLSLESLERNPAIKSLRQDLDDKTGKIASLNAKNQQRIEEIAANQESIWDSVKKVYSYTTDNQTRWILKEVGYILHIAQHRLTLGYDMQTARAALEAADDRLGELSDPRLLPVRKSIASQLQKLGRLNQVDYAGIELKIDTLLSSLHQAVLQSDEATSSPQEDTATNNEVDTPKQDRDLIEKALALTKNALSKKIIVTRNDQQVALFIEEQEKKRAYEFLHAKLIGAKYAVSTRDDNSFHQQIEAALAWLHEYKDLNNRQELISKISALNEIDLQPTVPDISEPYLKLQELMNSKEVAQE